MPMKIERAKKAPRAIPASIRPKNTEDPMYRRFTRSVAPRCGAFGSLTTATLSVVLSLCLSADLATGSTIRDRRALSPPIGTNRTPASVFSRVNTAPAYSMQMGNVFDGPAVGRIPDEVETVRQADLQGQLGPSPGVDFSNRVASAALPSEQPNSFFPVGQHGSLMARVVGEVRGTHSHEPAPSAVSREPWHWQASPAGLIYHSYMAGVKEPRLASQWTYLRGQGWIWDICLGGRTSLFRYGTSDAIRPEGWQLDVEGAAQPRLNIQESQDVMAVDFRFGIPLTYGHGPHQSKLAYYHLSSHLGDELMIKHPEVQRINYSRDAFVLGQSYYWREDIRIYGEAGWAFHVDGGSQPWEFQFGIDCSPAGPTGMRPVPFFAVNSHLREEVDYGGNLSVQTGWLWRGRAGHAFRMGLQYFTGKSDQREFFTQSEEKVGMGIWYDY